MSKATENTVAFTGRFIKIEQINSRDYYLFLKGEEDSVVKFITTMPISEDEIRLLKKSGNNIKLQYINFYNPVRKENEKIVKMMVPVYQFE